MNTLSNYINGELLYQQVQHIYPIRTRCTKGLPAVPDSDIHDIDHAVRSKSSLSQLVQYAQKSEQAIYLKWPMPSSPDQSELLNRKRRQRQAYTSC